MSLDLFNLFVSNIFGNIFLSMFGLMFIYLVIGIMGSMTMRSIVVVLGFFASVFLVGYLGSIPAVAIFLFCAYYFTSGLINWIQQMRT